MSGIFSRQIPRQEVVAAAKPIQQAERRVDRGAQEQAAALRARSRRGGMRSLLSAQREEAQTGLSTKLSGQ